jgi:ubiquinone/menaquinone biosynthesis C-methylase UbiE
MSEAINQKIQNDFDRIALLEQSGWNRNNHYYSYLLQQMPSHCENILEIGCGTGTFSRLLAKQVINKSKSENALILALFSSLGEAVANRKCHNKRGG